MPDARASLLVNEGDIAAVDDAREQFGGVGDEHAVLLVAPTANLAGDIAQDAQRIEVGGDGLGREIVSHARVIESEHGLDTVVQAVGIGLLDGRILPRDPLCEIVRQLAEPFARILVDDARLQLIEKHQARFVLPFEALRLQSVARHDGQPSFAQLARLAFDGIHGGVKHVAVGRHLLTVHRGRRLVSIVRAAQRLVVFIEELPPERLHVAAQDPRFAPLHLLLAEAQQPPEKLRVAPLTV